MDTTHPDAAGTPVCPSCGRRLPEDATQNLCPTCMLAGALERAQPASTLPPGERWGDFELLEEIGRGGMGIVWRARQVNLGRDVALKMILSGVFATEQDRRRFQTEAQAAASLDHPNIIPIYEVGEFNGNSFYAMKWVQSGSLSCALAKSVHSPIEAAALVAGMASGIHHAHQRGILHRDLKPANILLEDGVPLITDFGLAKRLEHSLEVTVAGSVIGSPGYMSPEQARGRTSELSTATDIYGLGAILYHLLTGQPPFRAESPLATLKLVVESDPPSPRTLNRRVDRDLENICLKCLAKEPARRYASADALREDLERWSRREPVRARRAPIWERVWKAARRHPAISAGVGAVLVTGALGVTAVRSQFTKTLIALDRAEANARAERSARAAVIESELFQQFDDPVTIASFSHGRQKLLFASGAQVFIHDAESGRRLTTLTGHTSFVRLADWSGDGRWILTASTCQDQPVWDSPLDPHGDQTARVWAADTGRQLLSIPSPFVEPISSITMDADGTHFGLGSVDGSLGVWTLGNTNPLFLSQVSTSQVLQARFSRDGSNILASSSGDHVWVLRKHPGGGLWASTSFSDENLIQAFDLGGLPSARFPAGSSGARRWGAHLGLPASSHRSSRTTFALSPDGTRLATAAREPSHCAIWNTATGERLFHLAGVTQSVAHVSFSQDGRMVAAGSSDRTARIWDAKQGGTVAILQPHPREVLRVAFAANPRWLLTVCADNRLRVWDVENAICVALLKGHRGKITFAEFSPDDDTIVSASQDGTARSWRWQTFEQMAVRLSGHNGAIRSIHFDPEAKRVVTASDDGTARVVETSRGRLLTVLDPLANLGKLADLLRNNNAGQMRDARFTPDGSKIVTARSDARLSISRNPLSKPFPGLFPPKAQPFLPGRIWDAESGAELAAVEGDRVAFIGVAFSPDDQRALFRGDEYPRKGGSSGAWWFRSTWSSHGGPHIAQALLWDIGSQEVIHIMDAGRSRLWVADFNPKNGEILTATDEALRFWSPEGVNDRVVPGATGCHWTAFSSDGSSVLSQDDEGYVALWDVESMNQRCRIDGAGKKPSVAWLMADGTAVGTLTEPGRLAFWNTPTGSLIWASEGSGANTGPVVMSANGRWLAAVVTEQRVDLWDLKARKLVRTIERHVYEVTALAFSRDSEWLATGDASGESWLWPLRLALP